MVKLKYPSKEIVAIIGLTILGVVFTNFGVSERILYGIVTGIAGIAGFRLGHEHAKNKFLIHKEVGRFPYYYRKLISTICYLSGAFLLAEHLWTHGSSWDWWSFPPGHELYAVIAIFVGILIGLRREKPHGKDG